MRRPSVCRAIRTTLAARVLDTGQIPDWAQDHAATCIRCQAVVAQTRRLRRTLATSVLSGANANAEARAGPFSGGHFGSGPLVGEGSPMPRRLVAAGIASMAVAVAMARVRGQRG